MNSEKRNMPTIVYVSAFLISIILFWTVANDWINLGSPVVFLAGLLGVALAVLLIGVWNMTRNSQSKGK